MFYPRPTRSLQDFGIGRSSMSEGGVGLFVAIGSCMAVALVAWARGTALRTGTPYQMTIELPVACGVTVGTPVRIRGVQVGTSNRVVNECELCGIINYASPITMSLIKTGLH